MEKSFADKLLSVDFTTQRQIVIGQREFIGLSQNLNHKKQHFWKILQFTPNRDRKNRQMSTTANNVIVIMSHANDAEG